MLSKAAAVALVVSIMHEDANHFYFVSDKDVSVFVSSYGTVMYSFKNESNYAYLL